MSSSPSLPGAHPDPLAEKRARLRAMLERRRDAERRPLAIGQQALWFLQRLRSDSSAYHVLFAARVRDLAAPERLAQALEQLTLRHPALRAKIVEQQGQPWMMEGPPFCLGRRHVEGVDEEELRRLVSDAAHRPFDFERGPLFRGELFSRAPDDHVLLVGLHHVIGDFWSLAVIMEDLDQLLAGRAPAAPSASYDSFVTWQRELLAEERGESQWRYWSQQLSGELPTLELPIDKTRPSEPRFRGDGATLTLSPELSAAVAAAAQSLGVTPFVWLLASYAAFLSRITGQAEFSIGSPFVARSRREFERTVGFFANMLPLRFDLSRGPTFRELVDQTRRLTLDALANQDYPFATIVQRLALDRDQSRTPVFQTMFAYERSQSRAGRGIASWMMGLAEQPLRLGGLTLEPFPLEQRASQFELGVFAEEADGCLRLCLQYDTDLLQRRTVERLAHHWIVLLESAAQAPDEQVAQLRLLDADDERVQLRGLNDTARPFPDNDLLLDAFDRQVRERPSAPAVSFGERTLTYQELSERATELAQRLGELGAGPDRLVAVPVRRSLELLVALYGILRSGAAYLPLDPDDPRCRETLEDASPMAVVLAAEESDEAWTNWPVVRISAGSSRSSVTRADEEQPHLPTAGPRDLAYVIYTSGSTGRPKGAMIEHRAIVNRLHWMQAEFPIGPGDRVLQKTPATFDVSVWEFFWPLMVGAELVVAPPGAHKDPQRLLELIRDREITTLHFVPSMLGEFLRVADQRAASLRRVFCSGEALSAEVRDACLRLLPAAELHNLYGPTEAAVDVTWWACRPGDRSPIVPIGYPIANIQTLVLDERRRLVPLGVAGELYLGGVGLGRGYLRREELTAERFIPHPWLPGERLYRTGDRVRQREDGCLEYLGRLDHQVKLRGLRIELGEIESALRACAGVVEAVVAVWGQGADAELAAYVVPGEPLLQVPDLRAELAKRLPEHMVPASFQFLERLPLSPNGKLDRRQLPRPERRRETGAEATAPRTATEHVLHEIWREVLGTAELGIFDDFFASGGHSLRAVQVASRVRERLGRELPLEQCFRARTIAALAELLDSSQAGNLGDTPLASSSEAELLAPRDNGPAPLSAAQHRLWLLWQLDPRSAYYNMPALLTLEGPLDVASLETSLREVLERHAALRSCVALDANGEPQLSVAASVPIDLTPCPVEGDESCRRLADEEARRPFDLLTGPLFRARLLRRGPDRHSLLLVMHHFVCDGWSLPLLLRGLAVGYERRTAVGGAAAHAADPGEPAAARDWQYADYARWERRWLAGDEAGRQREYWRTRLAEAPPVLELPTDRPRSASLSTQGALERVRVDSEVVDSLRRLASGEGATLFMLLLSAWQLLLSRVGSLPRVAVGVPIAGRGRREFEPLVGLFVNTVVVDCDVSSDPTYREFLAQVRDTSLAAFSHAQIPFDEVVALFADRRVPGRAPLAQTLFTLQADAGSLHVGPCRLTVDELETGTAKLELSLVLSESPDGSLGGWLEYNTELFEAVTVARWARQYRELVTAIAEHPDTPVSALRISDEAERSQLLAWSHGESERDSGVSPIGTVVDHLERWATHRPDSLALDDGVRQFTYGELWSWSGTWARDWARLGVAVGDRVALCLPRSPETVAAQLAAFRAGATFVSLDPQHPRQRLIELVEDSQPRLLVIAPDHPLAAEPFACPVFHGLAPQVRPTAPLADAGRKSPRPEDPAYVIYTSGSTGRPKGVIVRHASLTAFVAAMSHIEALGPNDRCSTVASPAFDASLYEIWPALCTGSALCFPLVDEIRDPQELLRAWRRLEVTRAFAPTPMAEELLRQSTWPAALRLLSLGGDALRVRPRPELTATVLNLYGPTETTIVSTYSRVGATSPHGLAPTIGHPMPGWRVYVLDETRRLAPLGAIGELYIGGAGVAEGYLGRPDLTEAAFVSLELLPGEAPQRLYRTGDRARWLSNGELEFLGRRDSQVKIRGVRIELGEVECELLRVPGVREAAVVATPSGASSALVGYVAPEAGASLTEGGVSAVLAQRLPGPLRPSRIVVLESLPKLSSGKLDRRALPQPSRESRPARSPRTADERALLELWQDVLGAEGISIDDDFFSLGGHSLAAARLAARIRRQWNVEAPLAELFSATTIERQAERLVAWRAAAVDPIEPATALDAPESAAAPSWPLSYAQERLWFLDQLEPGSPYYNIAAAVELSGPLDTERLRRAWEQLVERHEMLRCRVVTRQGRPAIVIDPSSRIDWRAIDVTGGAGGEADALRAAEQRSREEAATPFDLAEGPLARARLLRVGPERHRLVLVLHHFVADGWSMDVLFEDLRALWQAAETHEAARLRALPVRYVDFATWQRRRLAGERQERLVEWWRRQLDGLPDSLELPTDRPRPAVQSYRGAFVPFELPAALATQLRQLAQDEGATLFMTLLAGFQSLLSRWSGQRRVAVGAPVAGRERADLEPLVGMFVNSVVLDVSIAEGISFRELLRQSRERTLAALNHQELPFEQLVDRLVGARRDPSRSPLFQVMFALQRLGQVQRELGSLRLTPLPLETLSAKFDLTLALVEGSPDAPLRGGFEYNTDLFDSETVERLARHLVRLLTQACQSPDAELAALTLLDRSERLAIVGLGRGETRPLDDPRDLIERFEAAAAARPDAPAVQQGDASLDYATLNRRANQLAALYRQRGARPGAQVSICLPRGGDLIAAILAAVKCGAAYVPLDPRQPAARLRDLASRADAALLVSDRATSTALAGAVETPLLLLDDPLLDWSALPGDNPPGRDRLSDRLYVIFTSGSTGVPKGAAAGHRAHLNLVEWLTREHQLGVGDGYLIVTSHGFDLTQKDFFAPLTTGGRIVFPSVDHFDPEEVLAALARHGASVLNCTPSNVIGLLSGAGDDRLDALDQLRLLLVGGEPLDVTPFERWLRRPSCQVRLVNGYGPTECTDLTVAHELLDPLEYRGRSVPIGRPIPNTNTYVVDSRGEPVPLGVAGELCLGGLPVGEGYVNDAELTDRRFVTLDWADGDRVYRTGDLVRMRSDGVLDFLGRIDDQVKIRGNRLELGEIETALRSHSQVADAAVRVIRRDGADELAAYVVPLGALSLAEVREHLRRRLPAYMQPATFTTLERLPLSHHGKVDRGALPTPDRASVERRAPRPPSQLLESVLVAEIGAVLGRDDVGLDDDFFVLGGDSLRGAVLINRLQERLGERIPVATLFQHTTVVGLARAAAALSPRLDELSRLPPDTDLQGFVTTRPDVASEPRPLVDRSAPVPMSFAQERLWLLDQLDGGSTQYSMPLLLDLRGRLDVAALRQAFASIALRHEVLRSRCVWSEAGPRTHVDSGPRGDLLIEERLDESSAAKAEIAQLARGCAEREARRPFELSREHPWRGRLLRLAEDHHQLVLTLHHIAADGWSMGILLRELHEAYESALASRAPGWRPLAAQYLDLAAWQRASLERPEFAHHLDYWEGRLRDVPRLLEAPLDHPRRPGPQHAARLAVVLDEDTTAAVRAFSRECGATVFVGLLTAFQAWLHRLAGQEGVAVGVPIAGRDLPESEGLVGCFVNTVVASANFNATTTYREAVRRGADDWVESLPHHVVPFEHVVRRLQPSRDAAWSPLFQAMFALQDLPGDPPRLGELEVEASELTTDSAKFDLVLAFAERDGRLEGTFEYNASLWEPTTAQRMVTQLERMLEAAVAEPDRPLDELPLLSPAEQRTLLRWSGAELAAAPFESVVSRIRRFVESRPTADAVLDERRRLDFASLWDEAEQLANIMRTHGVEVGDRVAVLLPRGVDVAVAHLAVWFAGAAVVSLDPALPPRRLQFCLEDCSPRLLLCDEPVEAPCRVLSMRDERGAAQRVDRGLDADGAAQFIAPPPDQIAYLIYTSGSTGQPKAAMVPHGAFDNLLAWYVREFQIVPEDRATAAASTGFDASMWELWGHLSGGASVYSLDQETLLREPALRALLEGRGITSCFLPTALADRFLRSGMRAPSRLRMLHTGGDALRVRPATDFGARVINLYGPTEATIVTVWAEVLPESLESGPVPIGRPVDGVRLLVLDALRRPVAPGQRGELYLGGVPVGAGYLGRPELTAERFLREQESPLLGLGTLDLYQTGDDVRFRPDGQLEYFGRLDQQIQLRGARVELGEIEAAVLEHPAVGACAVVPVAAVDGEQVLVGFVEPRGAAQPDRDSSVSVHETAAITTSEPGELEGSLVRHLLNALPANLVPRVWRVLDVLPMNASGKIDRRRLAELAADVGGARPSATHTPPRDEWERTVAELWRESTGAEHVGIDDDFFADLGGHSLQAVALAAAMERTLEESLPLTLLFQRPTIRSLHEALSTRRRETPRIHRLRPQGNGRPLFCVHPAGGLAICYRELAHTLPPGFPVLGLIAHGIAEGERPHDNLAAMVEDLLPKIAAEQPNGPISLCGWSSGGVLAHALATEWVRRGGEVDRLVLLDTAMPTAQWRAEATRHADEAFGQELAEHLSDLGTADNGTLEHVRIPTALAAELERCRAVYRGVCQSLDDSAVERFPGMVIWLGADGRPLDGRVDDDPPGTSRAGDFHEPVEFWRSRSAELQTQLLSGNHRDIVFRPIESGLAKRLGELLLSRST